MEPALLLIPGPVPLHPRVLEELAKPAMPHYGRAWVKAYGEVQSLSRYLWAGPHARVISLAGPGHAGLEALAYTFLRPGDRVVVVSNGFFGERIREVLLTHRVKAELVASEWGEGPDVSGVRHALRQPARAVAVVHNETSTGVTNPLPELAEAAHGADAFLLVDAVSSLGGLPLPFEDLGIDAAFSASQKCLSGPAGLAPIAVAPSLWESAPAGDVDGWYMNLHTWAKYETEWGDWHPTPTTISSNVFYAFLRSLELVKEEGLEARIARHEKMAVRLRAGLTNRGFEPLGPPELRSNTVVCARPPAGIEANVLVKRLRMEHNIYISGGLGPLRTQTIRIGTMGTQADPAPIERLLRALDSLA